MAAGAIEKMKTPPNPFVETPRCGNCARALVRQLDAILCPIENWKVATDCCDRHMPFRRCPQ